jgi:nitrogen-specific signal transduction histidine kinase
VWIHGLGSKGNAAAEALNHLQEGVILLDARGLVLFANDAANLTLRHEKALKLTPTGIRAMSPLEDKKLARLVAEAITTGSGRGFQAEGTMTIELEFPRRFLHLSVIPLRSHAIQFGKASPVASIFLADTGRETLAPTRLLAQLYGMTQA